MTKVLQRFAKMFFVLGTGAILFSACATIVGGSRYYAHVTVENNPNATIFYKGGTTGRGDATFKAPRVEANAFSVTVKEGNCMEQEFIFTGRRFRTWAFVGTIVTWTGLTDEGIPLPFGVAIDAITGALWKPDESERGVTKIDYKHYNYLVNYTGCSQDSTKNTTTIMKPKTERLIELKELFDKGVLNQEEFEKEKKKILDE